MRAGPTTAARAIAEIIKIDAAPRSVVAWLTDVCLARQWSSDRAEARQRAEGWEDKALAVLRKDLSEYNRMGRFCPYDFNSSSEYMLQGTAFIEPIDSQEVASEKLALRQHSEYVKALRNLTPAEFERLSAGVLKLIGVEAPETTRRSDDQGIDFFGELKFASGLQAAQTGIEQQLRTWMVGQAKHYRGARVSTFEVRELVGSVVLARGQAFGSSFEALPGLTIRVCDPVFYLFFTTGGISANSWRLIQKSGVVGVDGEMLAAFLAKHDVGTINGTFDSEAFLLWLNTSLTP